jgi:hypothetical protein
LNYKDKTVAVYDFGTFLHLAVKLAESFGKVYYYSPWQSSFPKSNNMLIGSGIDNIIRVNNFFSIVDETDLFVFPDVHCGDIQVHLAEMGKRVWGSRNGEELEMYRGESKEYLKSAGIDIGPYAIITGTAALREYLKEHENQWVKMSITRGDMETFHSKNFNMIEPRIDELEWKLGAKKHIKEFIVEDAIDDAVETGYDGYCIDGKFPKGGMCGIEIKDKGYIIITHDATRPVPEIITGVNDKMSPALAEYNFRNFMSTELRVTRDLKSYLIDPCMRCGSPPSEVYCDLITNLADVIWNGAEGILVEPEFSHRYGVELLIHSQWAIENWQPIYFPAELSDVIKFRNICKIEGQYYVVPEVCGIPEVGAIVSCSDSLDDAVNQVNEIADKIESYDLQVFNDVIDEAKGKIEQLKEFGIDIDG